MKKIHLIFPFILLLAACDSLVSISDPSDRIPSSVAFSTDKLADAAMNGVYQSMLASNVTAAEGFASGNSTLFGGLSSDELTILQGQTSGFYRINTNHLVVLANPASSDLATDTDIIWTSAYKVIYAANAVIEGIAESRSNQLHDNVRTTLTAEAKFIRAFCHFYLVNFYGDVPLVLSIDYNTEIAKGRSPQEKVYQQIIEDLREAQANLPANYEVSRGRRVRANKWAATALLARVYLYTGDYADAAAQATEVINNTAQYALEDNLRNVFLTNSREAIWQLNQQFSSTSRNATPDGNVLLPYNIIPGTDTGYINFPVSDGLLHAFEPGDARRRLWIDSLLQYQIGDTLHFASKYQTGNFNNVNGAAPTEYQMVFRLAEQYLIRAEAAAHNGGGNAVSDLNIIRVRAGLPALPANLSQEQLLAAVAQEWRAEFFCEWGHRWFNLKRTGKARETLAQIPLKQPWAGDHQLLYPIPPADISIAPNLKQNPGY